MKLLNYTKKSTGNTRLRVSESAYLSLISNQIPIKVAVTSFILLITLLFSQHLMASSKWVLSKEKEGIQVYLRTTPNSGLKSFKGEMTVQRSLHSLLSVIDDVDAFPQWLYNCQSAKTLKKVNDKQTTNYIVTNMPWPVLNRDVVISSVVSQNKTTKEVQITLNSNPRFIPPAKGTVRIQTMNGFWLLRPISKTTTKVIYQLSLDPSGSIPTWLVNAMAVDLPFHTLNNLRRISNTKPYIHTKMKGIEELAN